MSVLSQTGEMKRIVDWILSADEDIQNLHKTWRFLKTSFSFPTIYNTQSYTPAAVSLTDLATWITHYGEDNAISLYSSAADESFLQYVPWEDFRPSYMIGSSRTTLERPSIVTVKPDNSLALWPLPNAVFTVSGEYYKTAQAMTVNASAPLYPSRFHMAAVWKGLMHYGAYAAANEKYAHGNNEYKKLIAQLEFAELEELHYGEPLA